jgi:TolB-like protein/cytochrome c-type biogenesis protein CcmH/NrfG
VILCFEDCELDRDKVELRRAGELIAVEPQVFALLVLLVENRERMVSRDEIVARVWDGRIVSESALDSRVKSARRAIGDDGRAQRLIRTLHGEGYRFVGTVREAASARRDGGDATIVLASAPALASSEASVVTPPLAAARPSIAVLPLRPIGDLGKYAPLADALADELIAELSRLRWLFVIARGSTFRLRAAEPDPVAVGERLGARYVLSGAVELSGRTLTVTVQLADTRDGGVVWGDRFVSKVADVHETRSTILARVVAAMELQIPLHEAQAARLIAPDDLDAWSAYHLGLQHVYRFNQADNAIAGELFARAVAGDPTFTRAHAALSFTRFQDAFVGYARDRHAAVLDARRHAERSIELDPLDPFANLVMGRSHWLEGDLDASTGWLERATRLSPSYAHAIYARAFTHAVSGRGAEGKGDADLAMALSPLDPLHYAMAATRALGHLACGEYAEAAAWSETAAHEPGAHVVIVIIALVAHEIGGDHARAASWAAVARRRAPGITHEDFLRSLPFSDPRERERIVRALAAHGF